MYFILLLIHVSLTTQAPPAMRHPDRSTPLLPEFV